LIFEELGFLVFNSTWSLTPILFSWDEGIELILREISCLLLLVSILFIFISLWFHIAVGKKTKKYYGGGGNVRKCMGFSACQSVADHLLPRGK